MSRFQQLAKWYTAQSFRPGIIGLLFNPYYIVRLKILQAIRRYAATMGGTLLDFGCGSKPYQNLFRVERYVGLDIKQSGHNHELETIDVYYDGKTIPFTENSFDSCFSSQVFEHVFDLQYSLQEIHRVLKLDGRCLFLVPFVWEEHETPFDFGRYSSFGLKYILESNGFAIIKQEPDSHFACVLAQLWCAYVHNIIRTKYRFLTAFFNVLFVFPFTCIGLVIQSIAPRSYSLYFNNVIVAKKIIAS